MPAHSDLATPVPPSVVEVKSGDTPIDRPQWTNSLGQYPNLVQEGLFVSWTSFKANVPKELATSFFRVRLWTQKDVLEQLFEHHDELDEDLKAKIPLTRISTVAAQGEEQ